MISTQVLQEFYVWAARKLRVDPALAQRIMRTFENMEIVQVEPRLIHEAIDMSIQCKLPFWDALVIVSAKSANCDRLYSEDLNAGQSYGTVKIESPFS